MTLLLQDLDGFVKTRHAVILVHIDEALGSTPREPGAWMLVAEDKTLGTIGGGQLEFHVIDIAREMLALEKIHRQLDMALGPHLGQCCGGRVRLTLERLTPENLAELRARHTTEAITRPQVVIFGAGHTGTALCHQLAQLPFKTTLIDDRNEAFAALPAQIDTLCLDNPLDYISTPPPNSAYIILTHSHALDYALTEAALKLPDAAYIGMIGSATKRELFSRFFLQNGGTAAQLARLTCPIGSKIPDKRPEIIAALTIAELIHTFA